MFQTIQSGREVARILEIEAGIGLRVFYHAAVMAKRCTKCGGVIDPSGFGMGKCAVCSQTQAIKEMESKRISKEDAQRYRAENGGGIGCVGSLIVIVIVGFVAMWGWGKFSDWRKGPEAVNRERIASNEKSTEEMHQKVKKLREEMGGPFAEEAKLRESEKQLLELQNEKKRLQQPAKDQGRDDPQNTLSSKRGNDAESVRKPQVLNSFGGISLPVSVTVVESVSLLNAAGEDTSFPAGSIIAVKERKPSGTLTTEINGSMFVGNESRLAGKVILR
jgi:hypothetical protein